MDSGFKIMQLLIDSSNHFASKKEIILKLWPENDKSPSYHPHNEPHKYNLHPYKTY